jgi:hypothetical protein
VIADNHGVISERVHSQHHGIAGAERDGQITSQKVVLIVAFEWRALNGVTAIDQQELRVVLPLVANNGAERR